MLLLLLLLLHCLSVCMPSEVSQSSLTVAYTAERSSHHVRVAFLGKQRKLPPLCFYCCQSALSLPPPGPNNLIACAAHKALLACIINLRVTSTDPPPSLHPTALPLQPSPTTQPLQIWLATGMQVAHLGAACQAASLVAGMQALPRGFCHALA